MIFENLPTTKFHTIVVDPPWKYADSLGAKGKSTDKSGMYAGVRGADSKYETLTVDQIATLPVGDIAEDDAHLYIWVTNSFIREGFQLMEEWGFEYKQMITWVKTKNGIVVPLDPSDLAFGMGWYYRNATEHALFGIRGKQPALSHSTRNIVFGEDPDNIVYAPLGEHSEKPDAFYQIVQGVSPGPRLDMFARKGHDGFDVWGNEAPSA